MFPLVSFAPLSYLRKALMFFCLFALISCKDFKNWESSYACKIKITFEPAKDENAPKALKSLHSIQLKEVSFLIKKSGEEAAASTLDKDIKLSLKPDADEVSFEIGNNSNYYNRVTICYKRIVSLISPEAGGYQMQYILKEIRLRTKNGKRPIFKKYKIETPVPLEKEKEETHVILYY